ncbi:hypothetical protein AYO44_13800 [Planctomycetaceae bacterium SCGC AG-212-F19]|nr:hypothetical protein AYO44_13800 [Planctomycetaceae bacterium SCGC AG-212-F19]
MLALDRFQYGYDRDGNPLYRSDLLNHSFDELYHANGASNGYDTLNRLTDFRRGTLTDSNSDGIPDTVTTASRAQNWSLDAQGNWSSVTSDGSTQTRTHNQQNEITSVSGLTTPTYDSNGNLTKDENGQQPVYDAWNRLVQVKNSGGTTASLGTVLINRTAKGRCRGFAERKKRTDNNMRAYFCFSPSFTLALAFSYSAAL